MSISEVGRIVRFSPSPDRSPASLGQRYRETGKRMWPVRCMPKLGNDSKPLLGLSYTVKDRQGLEHRVEEVLRLQTTRPNFGGVRWWFSCPVCSTVRSALAGLASSTAHREPILRLPPLPRPDLRELPEESPLRWAVCPDGGGSLWGEFRVCKVGFLLTGEGSEKAKGRALADAVGGLRRGVRWPRAMKTRVQLCGSVFLVAESHT